MPHGEDVDLFCQIGFAPSFLRRPPLRVRVLGWETAGCVRGGVPPPDDANVEVVELEGTPDADHIGRVDVEVDECGVVAVVAVNPVHIGKATGNVGRNAQSRERHLFVLVGQFPQSLPVGVLGNDRISAKAKHVDNVRGRSEPLHGHGVDAIVLKVLLLEAVLDPAEGRTIREHKGEIVSRMVRGVPSRAKQSPIRCARNPAGDNVLERLENDSVGSPMVG